MPERLLFRMGQTWLYIDVRCYEEIMVARGRSAGREGLDVIMERASNWIESRWMNHGMSETLKGEREGEGKGGGGWEWEWE